MDAASAFFGNLWQRVSHIGIKKEIRGVLFENRNGKGTG